MKSAILTLILAVIFLTGCAEQVTPRAWLIGGQDYDKEDNLTIGRVGCQFSSGTEIGAETIYNQGIREDQVYGVYALQEIPLVDGIGSQYLGAHSSIGYDHEEGSYYGFIAGNITPITPNVSLVAEYQLNELQEEIAAIKETDDEQLVNVGLLIEF